MQKIVKHKNQNFHSAAAYGESSDESCWYSYSRFINARPFSSICFLCFSWSTPCTTQTQTQLHINTRYTKLQLKIIYRAAWNADAV